MKFITRGSYSKIYLLLKNDKFYIVKIKKNKDNLNEIKCINFLIIEI